MTKALIGRPNLHSLVAARNMALDTMSEAVELLTRGFSMAAKASELEQHATGGAVFYGDDRRQSEKYRQLFQQWDGPASLEMYRKHLDASCWINAMALCGLDALMDAEAKAEQRRSLCAEVPEITVDNLMATLEHYAGTADLIFQRGLARVFAGLDRRFRSHDGFKLGSRIILTHFFDVWGQVNWSNQSIDKLVDVERVFMVLDQERGDCTSIGHLVRESHGSGLNPRQSETISRYFKIRGYMNGNCHVWFQRDDLVEKANLVLADYYGKVLPDGVGPEAPPSTALAKDLQFYWTPEAVVDRLLKNVYDLRGLKVLEPSAGEGHIAHALVRNGARVDAVEVHPDRAHKCSLLRSPDLEVHNANFLTWDGPRDYDLVVMNPPFYGTHWMLHVRKAFDHLKPGGRLITVLPVTAELGESSKHVEFRKWAQPHREHYHLFQDLPDASFADAGTRVHTVTMSLRKGS